MSRYTFRAQLEQGKAGEEMLDQHFLRWFRVLPVTMAEQRRGIDRVFVNRSTGRVYNVEYKTDRRANQTGNAFIETVSMDAPRRVDGWVYTCKADYLIYFCPAPDVIYVLLPAVLRAMLQEWSARYPTRSIPNVGYERSRSIEEIAKMNQWFRSWHGAPTDSKWILIAKRAGTTPGIVAGIAWALLDYASQQAERGSVRGFDLETYACWAGFDEEMVAGVIQAMREKGIIDGRERLAAWEVRQPEREETSTERVREWRVAQRMKRSATQRNAVQRDETECNALQQSATQCNAPDKDKERDTDKEGEREGAQPPTPARTHTPAQPRRLDSGNELFGEGSGKNAYEVYREVFKYIPSQYQIREMNTLIDDLGKWRGICRQWNLKGYRSNNIADLLKVYAIGWESGTASFVPRTTPKSKVDQSMEAVDRVFARMEAERDGVKQ